MRNNSELDREDYEFVKDIHGDVSRTFELALGKLSGGMEDVVRTSYLMCRIPDTIEDSGNIPVEKKSELLDQYLGIVNGETGYDIQSFVEDSYDALEHSADQWYDLEDIDENLSYWELLENTESVFNVFDQFDPGIKNCVETNVSEMVEGMRDNSQNIAGTDNQGIRINDLDELADYNYIVAGTVGNLLTDVFTYEHDFDDEDRLYELSEDFGHFLQTINIVKDPHDDYFEEDAIFLPDSLTEGDFHSEVVQELESNNGDREKLRDGVLEVVQHANNNSPEVAEYINIIEEESHEVASYLQVSALLAAATLREANESPLEAFEEDGISISKEEALTINQKAGNWEDAREAMGLVGEEPLITFPNWVKARVHDLKKKV